jgi:hypothetical protein
MLGMQPPPGAQPGMPPPQPQMMPNPAFQQWMQLKQMRDAEMQRLQKQFMAACELIKTDAAKAYKIDIEADSTVAADEQAEKQSRTEFLQAITPFMEAMVPLAQSNPDFKPLISELIMFGVRAFPTSRQLEDAFETAMEHMLQSPGAPPPQKGGNTKSPAEIQQEAQEAQGKIQVDSQANQVKMQTDSQANAVKLQQIASQQQIEREKLQAQQAKDAAELAMHGHEMDLRGREMQGKEQMETAKIEHMQARDTRGLV